MNTGTARYEAKRAAGITVVRRDGSLYSSETDEQAFAAEDFAAELFNQRADRTLLGKDGDRGYDFILKVEVVWLGYVKGTTQPRRHGHLIANQNNDGKPWPDLFIVVSGSTAAGFEAIGWLLTRELLTEPLRDFGFGPKHAISTDRLRSMEIIR
jgi:hypothetical protein